MNCKIPLQLLRTVTSTVPSHLTFQLRSAPIRQYTPILPFSFALHLSDSTLPSYLSASLCTYQTVQSHLTFQLRSARIRQYTPILTFSFALHISDSTVPSYLSASLCTYQTPRTLPSSSEKLLKISKRNLKSFGEFSFSFIAPSVWNSLPASLWNLPTLSGFKTQLKT